MEDLPENVGGFRGELLLSEFLERIVAGAQAYNNDLKAKAKKREDLIVALEYTVEAVVGYSGKGEGSYLEISVCSDSSVKKLRFNGWAPIEKGDRIRAYIFKGVRMFEREVNLGEIAEHPLIEFTDIAHWVERELLVEEHPEEIDRLRDDRLKSWTVAAIYYNK